MIEAAPEGGAVHTAKCALKENRPVLVVELPAGGNRELLAEGARSLPRGDDVVAAFENLPES